jgi:hypothetical protein
MILNQILMLTLLQMLTLECPVLGVQIRLLIILVFPQNNPSDDI